MDFNSLLDQLNCSAQTAVSVKSEILQSVLGVFQLDSLKKAVFRDVCGFHYLISTLASLIGSLAPRRCSPWVGGEWEGSEGVSWVGGEWEGSEGVSWVGGEWEVSGSGKGLVVRT